MKICPKCGSQNNDFAYKCVNCSEEFAMDNTISFFDAAPTGGDPASVSDNFSPSQSGEPIYQAPFQQTTYQQTPYPQGQSDMQPPYPQGQPVMQPTYPQGQPVMQPPYPQGQPVMQQPYPQGQPVMQPSYPQGQPGMQQPYPPQNMMTTTELVDKKRRNFDKFGNRMISKVAIIIPTVIIALFIVPCILVMPLGLIGWVVGITGCVIALTGFSSHNKAIAADDAEKAKKSAKQIRIGDIIAAIGLVVTLAFFGI